MLGEGPAGLRLPAAEPIDSAVKLMAQRADGSGIGERRRTLVMSDQHQTAAKPVKSQRRLEHHRERQATRAALNVSDLEDVLDPPRVHNTAAPGLPGPVEPKRRRFRHWKQPFWKRRSERRRARNVEMAHLDDE